MVELTYQDSVQRLDELNSPLPPMQPIIGKRIRDVCCLIKPTAKEITSSEYIWASQQDRLRLKRLSTHLFRQTLLIKHGERTSSRRSRGSKYGQLTVAVLDLLC